MFREDPIVSTNKRSTPLTPSLSTSIDTPRVYFSIIVSVQTLAPKTERPVLLGTSWRTRLSRFPYRPHEPSGRRSFGGDGGYRGWSSVAGTGRTSTKFTPTQNKELETLKLTPDSE